jgi:hypothetical protein
MLIKINLYFKKIFKNISDGAEAARRPFAAGKPAHGRAAQWLQHKDLLQKSKIDRALNAIPPVQLLLQKFSVSCLGQITRTPAPSRAA